MNEPAWFVLFFPRYLIKMLIQIICRVCLLVLSQLCKRFLYSLLVDVFLYGMKYLHTGSSHALFLGSRLHFHETMNYSQFYIFNLRIKRQNVPSLVRKLSSNHSFVSGVIGKCKLVKVSLRDDPCKQPPRNQVSG